ncbi:MAG: hypothetical protein FWF18_06000 [Dehalococcoidia bacterium]|nr:hypothetical protein [Dehalococcoidia bacterium]
MFKLFKAIFKAQKKYLAFFGIVPLLLTTAMIPVECPECEGRGVVSSTGMHNVTVVRLTYTTDINPVVGCNNYLAYKSSIHLVLLNSGEDNAHGYINMVLLDVSVGKIITTQTVTAEIPASTEAAYDFDITFQVYVDNPPITRVAAEVVNSDVQCISCNGKGTVAANYWPLVYVMKDSLKASQRIDKPWTPPPWEEPWEDL